MCQGANFDVWGTFPELCSFRTLLQVSRLAGVDLVRMRAGLKDENVMVNGHQISARLRPRRTSARSLRVLLCDFSSHSAIRQLACQP
jgi:hypothetical protein